jgi:drug/metabolite transporter (DMT)-like permease
LWAGNTVTVKLGAVGLLPWQANCARYLMALPILAATAAARPAPRRPPGRAASAWRSIVVPSVLEACIGSSLFVYALAHTDLAVGATLTSLAPLISVPLAILLGEERWSAPRTAAVAGTVAGVVLLVATH